MGRNGDHVVKQVVRLVFTLFLWGAFVSSSSMNAFTAAEAFNNVALTKVSHSAHHIQEGIDQSEDCHSTQKNDCVESVCCQLTQLLVKSHTHFPTLPIGDDVFLPESFLYSFSLIIPPYRPPIS